MFIGAIADDLTGATDLALMLAREGLEVLQVVGVPAPDSDFGSAEAVVVSLKSRTNPAEEAVAMSLASAEVLLAAGARQLFFKYCSTFDSTDEGNIGPVTDALLKRLGETRTIACPAFPVNKRTVYKGHLFVGDELLSDSPMKDHPLNPMRDANLVRVLGRQAKTPVSLIAYETVSQGPDVLAEALERLKGIAIVDAVSDADLRTIGRAAKGLRLITGGSGVALGLPANFLEAPRAPDTEPMAAAPGRAVVLAGSCSTATRRQVAAAIAAGMPAMRLDAMAIAEGRTRVEDALAFVREHADAIPLIYSSAEPEAVRAVQEQLGRNAAGETVEHYLAAVTQALKDEGFTRFLVAGGETSGAVVAALGVSALRIGPEIDPGVPWTVSHGTDQKLALALKSGNFGTDDFFIKAWDLLK
ncbi:four-carbon acid sugar kinase family protein [Arsenicitalea aurantiaca]|uniref:3-oxo-tetronate kinase n=1 Tax=Arsenicitalea aurantiaca TaxID=1783274 RepID=A0A433XFE1_9HYPH|nr:3-oxo-tetronate kinase [Arsenicitalea aurantiaca]RUT32819.1 four-carbon acid sugar kinase family protein [Arsenicitalea aurantiaca]